MLAAGCATTGKGASDQELIQSVLAAWKTRIQEVDVDGLMALISDSFSHSGADYEAEGKDGLRAFVEGLIEEGNFEDVEIYFEDVEISVEGATATVYPIDYETTQGAVTIELTLTKEKGSWLITDMGIEGL